VLKSQQHIYSLLKSIRRTVPSQFQSCFFSDFTKTPPTIVKPNAINSRLTLKVNNSTKHNGIIIGETLILRKPHWRCRLVRSICSTRTYGSLTLLLVILGIRIFALANCSLVDLDAWMAIFENHSTMGSGLLTVFGKFGLVC
jgi:hypothetical protein